MTQMHSAKTLCKAV